MKRVAMVCVMLVGCGATSNGPVLEGEDGSLALGAAAQLLTPPFGPAQRTHTVNGQAKLATSAQKVYLFGARFSAAGQAGGGLVLLDSSNGVARPTPRSLLDVRSHAVVADEVNGFYVGSQASGPSAILHLLADGQRDPSFQVVDSPFVDSADGQSHSMSELGSLTGLSVYDGVLYTGWSNGLAAIRMCGAPPGSCVPHAGEAIWAHYFEPYIEEGPAPDDPDRLVAEANTGCLAPSQGVLSFCTSLRFSGPAFAAVDASTGAPRPDLGASSYRNIRPIVAQGELGVYRAEGKLLSAYDSSNHLRWSASFGGDLTALVATPAGLFVAGEFRNVAGQPRAHLALLDETSGNVLSFRSDVNLDVPTSLAWNAGQLAVTTATGLLGPRARPGSLAQLDEDSRRLTDVRLPEGSRAASLVAADGDKFWAVDVGNQPSELRQFSADTGQMDFALSLREVSQILPVQGGIFLRGRFQIPCTSTGCAGATLTDAAVVTTTGETRSAPALPLARFANLTARGDTIYAVTWSDDHSEVPWDRSARVLAVDLTGNVVWERTFEQARPDDTYDVYKPQIAVVGAGVFVHNIGIRHALIPMGHYVLSTEVASTIRLDRANGQELSRIEARAISNPPGFAVDENFVYFDESEHGHPRIGVYTFDGARLPWAPKLEGYWVDSILPAERHLWVSTIGGSDWLLRAFPRQ